MAICVVCYTNIYNDRVHFKFRCSRFTYWSTAGKTRAEVDEPSFAALQTVTSGHARSKGYQRRTTSVHPRYLRKCRQSGILVLIFSFLAGSQPFGPLNIVTRPPVLIPRPETEHWTLRLADLLTPTPHRPISLLDLGTGTGCIPLLLCHSLPPGSVRSYGVDILPEAIELANENAAICGIPSSGDERTNTFKTFHASFLSPAFPARGMKPPFNVITSNPPYIPSNDYVKLPLSVRNYEDRKALLGGPSGLDYYHAIGRLVARKGFLTPDAVVVMEVGDGQANAVQEIMQTIGQMSQTEVWLDPWGKGRTVVART